MAQDTGRGDGLSASSKEDWDILGQSSINPFARGKKGKFEHRQVHRLRNSDPSACGTEEKTHEAHR